MSWCPFGCCSDKDRLGASLAMEIRLGHLLKVAYPHVCIWQVPRRRAVEEEYEVVPQNLTCRLLRLRCWTFP